MKSKLIEYFKNSIIKYNIYIDIEQMKKFVTILALILAFASFNAYSQTLKLVRTDVDSTRSHFVTATYIFGIDVYLDKVDSCTAVSFDLYYNESNYITFSEARTSEFGLYGKNPVIITKNDQSTNTGYIYVGVLSGDTAGSRGFDNPMVVHLEFVVSQNAPNGLTSTFSFSNIQAVVADGNSGKIISITADPITYSIHSFIDVWPGDANNDGVVDTKDFTTIGRFIGYGSGTKQMRSFKRASSSTLWAAQSVLAWDSTDVSYADCDGNGDVTVTDLLIARANFSKIHSLTTFKRLHYYDNISQEKVNIDNADLIPVYVNSSQPVMGISSRVSWDGIYDSDKVRGFIQGNFFDENYVYFNSNINTDEKYADIALISTGNSDDARSRGILGYLVVERDILNQNTQQPPLLLNPLGVNVGGRIVAISQYTDVAAADNDNSRNINIKYSNDIVTVNLPNSYLNYSYKIYDLSGNLIESNNFPAGKQGYISSWNLNSGAYYLNIFNGKELNRFKLMIVH